MKYVIGSVMATALFFPFFYLENNAAIGDPSFDFYVIPYFQEDKAEFTLILENKGDEPVTFEFPSSQRFDIQIFSLADEEVYRYSKDKMFTQVVEKITLKAKEKKVWTIPWDYRWKKDRLKEGEYQLKAVFTAGKINGQIASKINFETKVFIPEENPYFRNAVVKGSGGEYEITGEMRPETGLFFYTVEDGHVQYINETKGRKTSEFPKWEPFQLNISLDKENLPENGVLILNLYERSKKGEIIHIYPIVLEKFY